MVIFVGDEGSDAGNSSIALVVEATRSVDVLIGEDVTRVNSCATYADSERSEGLKRSQKPKLRFAQPDADGTAEVIPTVEDANAIVGEMENHLDMICHELRNPMSSILQSAEFAVDALENFKETGKMDLSGVIESCRTIMMCVSHQRRILDDNLTTKKAIKERVLSKYHDRDQTSAPSKSKSSKSIAANLTLKTKPMQPIRTLHDCVNMFRADHRSLNGQDNPARCTIRFQTCESYNKFGINWVQADQGRLSQIIVNLLTNAVKFTTGRPERIITVRVGASKTLPVAEEGVVFLQGANQEETEESELSDCESSKPDVSPIDDAYRTDCASRRSGRLLKLRNFVVKANDELTDLFVSQGYFTDKESASVYTTENESTRYTDASETLLKDQNKTPPSPRLHLRRPTDASNADVKEKQTVSILIPTEGQRHFQESEHDDAHERLTVQIPVPTKRQRALSSPKTSRHDSTDSHGGSYYNSPLLPKDNPDLMSDEVDDADAKSFVAPEDFLKPDRDDITVPIEGEDMYIVVSVHDTGIGIHPEKTKLLFKRFSQVSGDEAQYGGSGLGLYISRELARLHGGDLGVYSKYGVGSNFAFYIKVKTCAKPKPQPKMSVSGQQLLKGHSSHPSTASLKGPFQPSLLSPTDSHNAINMFAHEASSITGFSFLIVDDNQIARDVMKKRLGNMGCQVHIAETGKKAIEFLKKSRLAPGSRVDAPHVDIVLMDSQMPEMNGIDATGMIRRLEENEELLGRIVILGIPADVNEENLAKLKQAGMDDTITKPFKLTELVEKCSSLLKRRSISHWTGMNGPESVDSPCANSMGSSVSPASSSSSNFSTAASVISNDGN